MPETARYHRFVRALDLRLLVLKRSTQQERNLPTAAYAVLAGIGVIGVVHLPASFAPGIRTWGLDYWSEIPISLRMSLALLICLLALPAVAKVVDRTACKALERRAVTAAAALSLPLLVVLFRSRGYAYGDGYSFFAHLQSEALPHLFDQLLRQPLDIIAHWIVNRAVVVPLGLPAAMSYSFLGALAGVASIWATVRIARHLAHDSSGVRLIVASAFTSGAVLFLFGHVESYSLANCMLLWSLSFALEAMRHGRSIWWAWAACVVGIAFHQLVIVMVPVLVWVHWTLRKPIAPGKGAGRALLLFACGFLIWLAGALTYNLLADPIFVPLLPTADSAYTAFSPHHLIDVFNLIFFLSPLVLVALFGVLRPEAQQEPQAADSHRIVAATAASAFYFAFWVDPFLGAFRDWDLLAAFGIPASIWAASVLLRKFELGKVRTLLWVSVAGLAIAHAGAFVVTVQDETAVALRVDRMVRADIHYSADFYKGTRLAPWARTLDRVLGRHDLERDHLARWTALDPSNAEAWANLANAYHKLRMGDSALYCFEKAWQLDPANDAYGYNSALLRLRSGDSTGAVSALERVVTLSDTSYTARLLLGTVCLKLGMLERAESALKDAIQLNPRPPEAHARLSELQERRARVRKTDN